MISKKDFKKIEDAMPIICVDAIILRNGKVLLARRVIEPGKAEWWTIGGIVRKGESLEEALTRTVKTETGLEIVQMRKIDIMDIRVANRHAFSLYFLVIPNGNQVKLDSQHDEFAWFSPIKLPDNVSPYVRTMINNAIN